MSMEECYAKAMQDAIEHPENYNDIFEGYENDLPKALAFIEWQKQEIECLTRQIDAYGLAIKKLAEKSEIGVAPRAETVEEILALIDDKIRFEVEVCNGFLSARHSKTLYQERINALNDMKLIIKHQFREELKKKCTEGQ